MSNKNTFNEEINNEEEIIISLMNEIFQYENKIKEINNILMNNNSNRNKNFIELSNLKKEKLFLQEKISELGQKIEEKKRIKEEQINFKELMINEIENKIEEYKYQINTFNFLNFEPFISEKLISNKNKNDILTNEQINEIIKIKKKKENSHDIKEKQNEIINNNKKKEQDIINNIKAINMKKNEINERIKMLKEEKHTINNELINIISCKESIDALIKFNHYLLKNYQDIKTIKGNKNNIKENNEICNDKEIYYKNKWKSPIKIYYHELKIIDVNKFSNGFNEIILDLFDFINNNDKNLGNGINLKQNFISYEEIIAKQFKLLINKIENRLTEYNENNFLNLITSTIINNVIPIMKIYNEGININELKQNIVIYLSYYLKELYYEKIISENLKFINKEYKYNKKELEKQINEFNNEEKKQEIIKMDITERINNVEKDMEIIDNQSIKNKLLNNIKEDNTINISKEEHNYLQLCYNINNLNIQKNTLLSECAKITNEFDLEKNQIILEKKNYEKKLDEIDNKINILSSQLEQATLKANNEIIEYRKIIAEKYNNIKTHLKKCKKIYGNNEEEYNSLLDNINETIHQKNKDNLNIKELQSIKLISSNDYSYQLSKLRNEKLRKYSFYSYDNKIIKSSDFNFSEDKNLEDKLVLNYDNDNKKKNNNGRRNSDKNKRNIFSSNKLLKHRNYYYKYFRSNSKNDTKEKNKRKNLKSFSHLHFYKSLYNKPGINNQYEIISQKNTINKVSNSTSFIDKYAKNLLYAFNQNKDNFNSINLSKSINAFKNTNKTYNSYNKEKLFIKQFNDDKNNNKIPIQKTVEKYDTSKELFKKLNSLFNITFCYIRKIKTKIYHKYNPIQISINKKIQKNSSDYLTKSPFFFDRATISLNKSYKSLRIVYTSQLDPVDINIKNIKFTTIRTTIKVIIEIYRDYKKCVKNGNENFQKDLFIKKEMKKYNNLSYEYISKCIDNNKFNLLVYMESGEQIEFVFCSYDEFKIWINGFALLIKYKDKLTNLKIDE